MPATKEGIPAKSQLRHKFIIPQSAYRFCFRKAGWKVKGKLPDARKYILIVAPHTSNWDFLVGLGARAILNFDPKYVGKKELFRWPFGGLFRALGGYPVERTKQTNFVQAVADIFKKEDDFILTITPEGTRSKVDNWKTGFYYIAEKANVPILPVAFDYSTKTVVLGELKTTDQDVDSLIAELKQWYSQFPGKYPHKGVV